MSVHSRCRHMSHRARCNEAYAPTTVEHIANIATHAIFIIPACLAGRMLIKSTKTHTEFIVAWVYSTAIFTLFTMSSIYHWIAFIGHQRKLTFYLHIVDRASIYVFIAASYNPWLYLRDSGPFGRIMRWFVWLFACLGILFQYNYHERYKCVETSLYLFLGLFPALAVLCMRDWSGLTIMAAGGTVYMIGVIFFKCDGIIPCAHAIWHMHVVIGAMFQFYAVHRYLIGGDKNNLDSYNYNVEG